MDDFFKPNLACPNCGNQACSLWRKGWAGWAFPVHCQSCGALVRLRVIDLFIPSLLVVLYVLFKLTTLNGAKVIFADLLILLFLFILAIVTIWVWTPLVLARKPQRGE